MQIVGLKVENFMKIKAVTIVPKGNLIKIVGPNGSGKTSMIKAIWAVLGGKENRPEQPIRKGETKATVDLDLGELKAYLKITPGSEVIEVRNKDNFKATSPQAILDKLRSKLTFNILEFYRAKDAEQYDMLLRAIDLQVDEEKLPEIKGLKITDPIQKLKQARKSVYDERTIANREVDRTKKVFESIPEIKETKSVSAKELMEEKERLENENREIEKAGDQLESGRVEIGEIEDGIVLVENEISKLEEQIGKLREKLKKGYELLESSTKAHCESALNYSVLVLNDLTEITQKINDADETNQKATQYQNRLKAKEDYDTAEIESKRLSSRIDAIDSYQKEILSKTKFPVEGLSIDPESGKVLYNDLPLSQAGGLERLRVSLAMAVAQNPDLRIAIFDDEVSLTPEGWQLIEEFAAKHDFQVWTTLADSSGQCGIVIEDGEVKTQNETEEK